jgi:hypothetical protein
MFIAASLALPALAGAEDAAPQTPAPKPKTNNLRLAAGYYLCPFSGVGYGGWEIGASYHYNIADYALVGPTVYYTGLTGEKLLSDLPFYPDKQQNTKLAIHQIKFGVKGLVNPAQKMSKVKYIWPYGGVDLGLAVQYVTDRGNTPTHVAQTTADFYIKPVLGMLFYPRVPFTAYFELSYNFIPTYAFMDKKFNLYGAPTPVGTSLRTDGLIFEAGFSYLF